jgi:DNA-binding MarR family transcriptional regulator
MRDTKYKKISSLLLRADVKYRRALTTILEPYQLTILQFEMMRVLNKTGQIIGTKFIKSNLTNPDAAISKSLDELATMGIVVRDRAISNRRKIEVELTPLGKSIIETIEEKTPESMLLGELVNEELEQLNQLLTKIIKTLE